MRMHYLVRRLSSLVDTRFQPMDPTLYGWEEKDGFCSQRNSFAKYQNTLSKRVDVRPLDVAVDEYQAPVRSIVSVEVAAHEKTYTATTHELSEECIADII